MKMKKILAMALASAMVLSLGACGSSDAGSASGTDSSAASDGTETASTAFPGTAEEDTYVVDLRSEPAELNSVKTTDVPSGDILREIMVGLYKLDENDKPQPDLAVETQVSDDGCTYTMKLREDAKWTNGEPVTAHDFVYSYQTICSKEAASSYAFIVYDNLVNGKEVYEGTKDPSELGVKAIDDYTLEVTFQNPIPYATHLFSFASYYPLNQKAYEEIGPDVYGDDADKLVTNGAYTMSEWVHNDHITLTKNEDFYDPDRCAAGTIRYTMMNDTNTRMNAFQGGQVDCINLAADQIEQAASLGIKTESYVDNGNWYIQFNTLKTDKGLDNANIRRGLGMAINTQSLCDDILKDGSVPATGLVPTTISGANGEKFRDAAGDVVNYDPEAAKEAFEKGLQETGLSADSLNLSLLCDDLTNAQRTAEFFQAQWKENLGIDVTITPQPFKSRLDSMDNGDFDMVFAGWSPDYNDPMTFLDMFTTTNGNNYGKYSSAEYDSLVTSAMSEGDAVARQDMLAQAEKIVAYDDAAIYPLYFSGVTYAVSDKIQNMTRTGFQEFDFTDAPSSSDNSGETAEAETEEAAE
ncbi:MAG TPA: peptide ABC transporter substrate-binding protein [Candidatus Blautia merdipullorum]|nr:peptide ABC transporter substrate-binding protein [Candidatus Blautia merdipullorum]